MHVDAKPWVDKAEGDYEGALTLVKKRSEKVAHLTCFAAQQCAEKYMKAFLVERNVPFSKTHNLTKDLLPQCLNIDDEFSSLHRELEFLNPYAVESRYPGDVVTHKEAVEAVKAAKVVRKFIRGKLDLEKQRRLL
jgi:HEPN domain-containing protein